MPIVSIITPSFNCIEFIDETFNSILEQTLNDWEWIVTDDCSTDGTYEYLLQKAALDSRIIVYRNGSNSGAAVSRNNSIKHATGRYIAFLDSDDLWENDKLKVQISFMSHNNIAFSYTDYSFLKESGEIIDKARVLPVTLTYRQLLNENLIGCLTVMYDSRKLGKMYMPLIRRRQDYGLWLDILKTVPIAHKCPGILAKYRQRTSSVSSNKLKLLRYNFELFYKHQNMPIHMASYYLFLNVFNKLFKKNKVKIQMDS
ncbi:glycosyltransferase family 2 protein [Vibrio comitans]|uniref:Putative teichuronic acid biosynthesis glycosyltransferase TuaG n=1 Tax=Vibrio comitans NBRC 102076 TaxID=1219078 RepID=A0A4Y3IS12_9VIBR|nr:glycosyltransferase family 2 protein [Vibrio comitans]GEA61997.1 putative teichuronic acid biosynthesis glycosyltransferase TuaG [Vibrio comitans NBRC 102076]